MAFGQAQPSTLDLIPGARNAVNYLMSKVADFQRVPQRLSVAQTNLINVKRVAESKNQIGYATEAALALQNVFNLQGEYTKASVSVGNAMDQLRTSGLLSGPLEVAGAVIDASSRVTAILGGTANVERSVTSISAKVMSPEEQARLTQPAGGKVTMMQYLLYGGLFYVGLWALRKSGGTRKF
jgi:hypothetical protein